jgi:aldose 1-epimerase
MVRPTRTAAAEAPGAATPHTIELVHGRLRASIAPEVGGAIAALAFEISPGVWFDILRPATPQALEARNPREMACFPMVPFASLVHQGRFSFAGKAYQLRHNLPGHDAALHGDGWQHGWDVDRRTPRSARLSYRQNGDRFPFRYEAHQQIRLEHDALVLSLSITNGGDAQMPAGLGFHPFFPLTPDVTLQFEAGGVWTRDEAGRVIKLNVSSHETSFAAPVRVWGKPRNDVYEGWGRNARIEWAASGMRAELQAQPPLSRVLVFVPEKRPVFCVEPICNLPDGFNLLGSSALEPGIAILSPGETLTGEMRLACRPS